jgi:hypothetical protein
MRVWSLDYYSFMSLNLLLRHPTYSSLYDLYVYKLNATDSKPKEMLDSMTNEVLIFLPRIEGLKGLIVEYGMLNK